MDALNEWHFKQVQLNLAGAAERDMARGLSTYRITPGVLPLLQCNDGFHMSVQASDTHYCEPEADYAWPYARFEAHNLSAPEEAITANYATGGEDGTDGPYARVPLANLLLVIEKHGGIKEQP